MAKGEKEIVTLLINHPEIVNINIFGFTEKDIKIVVEYLAINPKLNKDLIDKMLKFGNYMKRCNHE